MSQLTDILIVDDEDELTAALSERLALRGYCATGVLSGKDALSAVAESSFDVVLLDVRLKGEDGIDVMRKIHAIRPDLPVILLTGHIASAAGEAGIEAGAADTILKPVELGELIERMKAAVSRNRRKGEGL